MYLFEFDVVAIRIVHEAHGHRPFGQVEGHRLGDEGNPLGLQFGYRLVEVVHGERHVGGTDRPQRLHHGPCFRPQDLHDVDEDVGLAGHLEAGRCTRGTRESEHSIDGRLRELMLLYLHQAQLPDVEVQGPLGVADRDGNVIEHSNLHKQSPFNLGCP